MDNMEMGQHWYKKVVKKLVLALVDADGDMHMMCWDLDKDFLEED